MPQFATTNQNVPSGLDLSSILSQLFPGASVEDIGKELAKRGIASLPRSAGGLEAILGPYLRTVIDKSGPGGAPQAVVNLAKDQLGPSSENTVGLGSWLDHAFRTFVNGAQSTRNIDSSAMLHRLAAMIALLGDRGQTAITQNAQTGPREIAMLLKLLGQGRIF